jgi:hypothetical protein
MAGKKGKSGGHGINAGRHKKEQVRVKFQIMAYPNTIQAIKELKHKCTNDKELDFVDELNRLILSALQLQSTPSPLL